MFDDKYLQRINQRKDISQGLDSLVSAFVCSLISDFPRAARKVGLPPVAITYKQVKTGFFSTKSEPAILGWIIYQKYEMMYTENWYITTEGTGYYKYEPDRKEYSTGIMKHRALSSPELAKFLIEKHSEYAKSSASATAAEMSDSLKECIKSTLMRVLEKQEKFY